MAVPFMLYYFRRRRVLGWMHGLMHDGMGMYHSGAGLGVNMVAFGTTVGCSTCGDEHLTLLYVTCAHRNCHRTQPFPSGVIAAIHVESSGHDLCLFSHQAHSSKAFMGQPYRQAATNNGNTEESSNLVQS
jgi:hypothetical protein